MRRIFVISIFAVFVGASSFMAEEIFFPIGNRFRKDSTESKISQDLKKLTLDEQLPSEFSDLHQVFISDHRIKKDELNWQKLSLLHFPQKSTGRYDLQIEVFDAEMDPVMHAADLVIVLQMSLFDAKTKNKMWELSRSYKVSELKN